MAARASFVDYGLLVLLASIFSGAFLLIAIGVRDIPPATLVVIRQGLAAMILIAFMRYRGQWFPQIGAVWIWIVAGAVLGNSLPFFLIAWGQEKVDAGLAAILTSSTPIIALIVGHLVTNDERFNIWRFIGVGLGFLGVVILFGFENLFSLGDESVRQYALLAAATCYAVNAFVLRRLSKLPRFSTVAAMLTVSCLLMVPFSVVMDQPWSLDPGYASITAIVLLGILSTAGGNLLRFEIVARRGALFLTQISYLIPSFGLFWAWAFLDEVPDAQTWASLLLILSGIWFIQRGANASQSATRVADPNKA